MSLRHFLSLLNIAEIIDSNALSPTDAHSDTLVVCTGQDCLSSLVLAFEDNESIYCQHDHKTYLINKTHLDCIIFRSWLFAIMTSIEEAMRRDMLSSAFWQDALSPERLEKARTLKQERERVGQAVDTLSCLQFGDVGQASFKKSSWLNVFGFGSRKKAKKQMRGLERLRNNLVHGQNVIAENWDTIVLLAMHIEQIKEIS